MASLDADSVPNRSSDSNRWTVAFTMTRFRQRILLLFLFSTMAFSGVRVLLGSVSTWSLPTAGRIVETMTTTTITTKTIPTTAMTPVYDYYEREFPYETTCGSSTFSSTSNNSNDHQHHLYHNVSIVLAYHVGLLKNWKNVVLDQLHTLHQCGLGHLARHLFLSYSGGNGGSRGRDHPVVLEMGELSSLFLMPPPLLSQALPYPYNFSFRLERVLQPQTSPWEGPMMNALHQYCSQPQHSDAVVFYFHNKGVSKYRDNWRNKTADDWSYARVLYWRKFLEYFTLERPHLCLHEIVHNNKSVCGSNFQRGPPHYSGNFWVAKCDYVASLTPLNLSDPNLNYVASEMWIGRKYDQRRFTSLFDRQAGQLGLYRHWIQPSEYRYPEDLPPRNISSLPTGYG